MSKNLIKIGFVTYPHGIRGDAELRLLNDNYDECVLDDGMIVTLMPGSPKSKLPSSGVECEIEKLRFGNKVIMTLKGIKDRTHLESWLPFDLYLDREDFPEAQDGEVYLVDLIGLDVVSPEGEKLGVLESFSDNGMQYLFEVKLLSGELMTLPYVDSFFPEINTQAGTIVMIMPEYEE